MSTILFLIAALAGILALFGITIGGKSLLIVAVIFIACGLAAWSAGAPTFWARRPPPA